MGSSLFCATSMMAQAQGTEATTDEDIVYLSPFEVTSEGSIGYQARDTLAGTRLRTDLKDVANAVQVINNQFLQDTGATDTKSLLVYTTNTEVGGIGGNFTNVGDSTTPNDVQARVSPQTNTRVRGLTSADNTRNFFLTRTPWDGYNVDRVDIQRGANSLLFGIGSPAGIVNTNIQGASMFNEGKIEAKIGSYGSIRGSVNVNHVILDGELAVRIAGLYDNEKYRQKPAFEKDERVYAAVRYDPKWAKIGSSKLSIKANYEHGDIEANRPRVNPPQDKITPYFTDSRFYSNGKHFAYDGKIINSSDAELYLAQTTPDPSFGALQSSLHRNDWGDIYPDDGVWTGSIANPNYNPWMQYWGSDYYGLVAVYNDPNSSEMSYWSVGSTMSTTGSSVNAGVSTYLAAAGVGSVSQYALNAHLAGSDIGAWKNVSLSDDSIFDYYNNLLDGDTKRELEDWDNFNLTVSETFMDDMFGVEFAYNYENDTQTYKTRIVPSGYAISIDVNKYLADGVTPNPGYGKAYVGSRSTGYSDKQMNQTIRGTAFADFDFKKFMDPDSLGARIIGRHVFQGNWSRMSINTQHRGWMGLTSADWFSGAGSINAGARYVATMTYLSAADLTGLTSASGLNLSRIKADRDPGTGTISTGLYNNTTGSLVTNYPVSIWSDNNKSDMKNLYNSMECWDSKTVTETYGVIWNGYMLDNCLVPTVGYRKDEQKFYGSGNANINTVDGIANFNDPEWYVPTSAKDAMASSIDTTKGNRRYFYNEGNSTSWGIVGHMPEFVQKMLPYGLNFSVFYNKSDNFSPDASRIDLEGNPIDGMKGDTKDYGFIISALDDRISLKVNWYKTTVENATMNDAIVNCYMLGMGEGWAVRSALAGHYAILSHGQVAAQNFGGSNDFNYSGSDLNGDGVTGDFLPWSRSGYTEAESFAHFEDAYNALMDTTKQPSEAFQRTWLGGETISEFAAECETLYKAGDYSALSKKITNGMSSGQPQGLYVTGTTESEGIEFELNAQITPNWNVAINAAKTEATRTTLGDSWADFTNNRQQLYQTAYGDMLLWGPWEGDTLRSKWMSEYYGNYLLQRALMGSNVPELCKWRLNLVTNYTFSDGMLKGFNIGGAYRWQDKTAIGYPLKYKADGTLDLQYVGGVGYSQFDLDKPYYNDAQNTFDLWVGYEHQINDDVTWRIQLNVRNLFADEDLIPISTNPYDADGDGVYESATPANYRIPDETTWYITNTFTF
jgi:outer membrane receptor for ferric coprogen and ferric-rhodotorulic acid